MAQKPKKRKVPRYTADFITALSPVDCRARLERDPYDMPRGLGGALAPMTQTTHLIGDDSFTVERSFPGAVNPIRFNGQLNPNEAGGGTWVHGAVTHDPANQIMLEGLGVFVTFFLLSTLLFFRLGADTFVVTVPLVGLLLAMLSVRWRALQRAAEDLPRWLRRKLYLTEEQERVRHS